MKIINTDTSFSSDEENCDRFSEKSKGSDKRIDRVRLDRRKKGECAKHDYYFCFLLLPSLIFCLSFISFVHVSDSPSRKTINIMGPVYTVRH